jgi:tRNA (adenine57-N1/adenine58-N1)-methyltransferase
MPTLAQFVMHMQRTGQIIYPKDMAVILVWADVFPGARVVEGGTGSGAMTMALARAVGSEGQVFSYEVREDVARRAEKNVIRFLGKTGQVMFRSADIYAGIQETGVDRIILDVPEPWNVVEHACIALKPGGLLASYLPTILQVRRLVDTLQNSPSFCCEQTIEVLIRPWNVDGMSVRPVHRMVAHTGFIVTACCRELPA